MLYDDSRHKDSVPGLVQPSVLVERCARTASDLVQPLWKFLHRRLSRGMGLDTFVTARFCMRAGLEPVFQHLTFWITWPLKRSTSLWSNYHLGSMVGHGIWPQRYGSLASDMFTWPCLPAREALDSLFLGLAGFQDSSHGRAEAFNTTLPTELGSPKRWLSCHLETFQISTALPFPKLRCKHVVGPVLRMVVLRRVPLHFHVNLEECNS